MCGVIAMGWCDSSQRFTVSTDSPDDAMVTELRNKSMPVVAKKRALGANCLERGVWHHIDRPDSDVHQVATEIKDLWRDAAAQWLVSKTGSCRRGTGVRPWYRPYFRPSGNPLVLVPSECGYSLGPATITPEVEVEIRAAEIASQVDALMGRDGPAVAMSPMEYYGWIEHMDQDEGVDCDLVEGGEAGWLAREILYG